MTTDGKTHELADVWLASTSGTGDTINQLTSALNQYAAIGTTSVNLNTNALSSPAVPALNPVVPVSTNTSSLLASALSQYDANGQLILNTQNTGSTGVLINSNPNATTNTNQLLGGPVVESNTNSLIPTGNKIG
jgi:hypothetical protein